MEDIEIIDALLSGNQFRCNEVVIEKFGIVVKLGAIQSIDITKELTDWINKFDREYYIDHNFALHIRRKDGKKL